MDEIDREASYFDADYPQLRSKLSPPSVTQAAERQNAAVVDNPELGTSDFRPSAAVQCWDAGCSSDI